MSLSDHVSLTITQDSVGVARAGFGVPLILSATAAWVERVRFYNSLSDVAADFPVTTSAEYLAAAAMFSQAPRPARIAIGRSALKPTQVYTIVPTERNSHTFKLTVRGKGVTPTEIAVTSDSDATATEITTLLKDALNAVVGKNFTATGTATCIVTGTAAGDWFSIEVANPADLAISQTHTDPGVATDLAAIQLENDEWYALVTLYNSKAYVQAAAAWIAAQKKIYVLDVNETAAITTSVGNTDTLDALHTSGYARVMGAYHPSPAAMMAAAWLGRCLPLEPGSESWKFKSLAGVPPVALTATHRTNLVARKANSYQRVAGVPMTWEGTTADGDFLDVQRGLDWLEDDMGKGVFGALAGASKVPYTDAGVAVVESEMRASLRRAVNRGILAADPEPTVSVPRVADVSTSDKSLRILPDAKFTGVLAGAVHKVNLSGVVSA